MPNKIGLLVPIFVVFLVFSARSTPTFDSLYQAAKTSKSIPEAKLALDFAKQLGNETFQAKTYFLIAYLQDLDYMYYEALNNYFSALKLYRETDNVPRQIIVLRNIGIIYATATFFEKALSFYKDAAGLADETADQDARLILQYQMARAYRLSGDFAQAKAIYLELADAYAATNQKMASFCYTELGFMAAKQDSFALAKDFYHRSTTIFTDHNRDKELATLRQMNSLSYIYRQENRIDSAKSFLTYALTLSTDSVFNRKALVDIYHSLGQIYDDQGRKDSAVYMFEKRMQYDQVAAFHADFLPTAQYLFAHYHQQNPEKSLQYYTLTHDFGKELRQLQENLTEGHYRYQVEAANYRHEIALKHQRQQQLAWLSGLVAFLLVLAVLYHLYQRRKGIQDARQVLNKLSYKTPSVT